MTIRIGRVFLRVVVAGALLLPGVARFAAAGTTGKLSGRVLDAAKQPLAGVNVAVPAARTGALTDADGRFVIVNVPSGTYDVRMSLVGYQATTFTGVVVSADETARLDATLPLAPVSMKEVVVSAQRPIVDLQRTSTLASVSRKQIQTLPVQELQDVVDLQAGVVEGGHFRGGRKGEVQYQVDGVTVNNVYDNSATLKIDRSLLEEVQVVSGTFDAEYGQAMSGVVNAVLRRGTDHFQWDGEALLGGFYYPSGRRIYSAVGSPSAYGTAAPSVDPFTARLGNQNYQLNASGPTLLPKTTYLLSGRYNHFDDWIYGIRRFRPTDRDTATGDGEQVPLAYNYQWSGIAKLTNRSLGKVELNYQALFNVIDARRADWAWRLNPDGISKQRTLSVTHGLDLTHTLGPKTYYTVSMRQNFYNYRDALYPSLWDPRYVEGGLPFSASADYELGAVVWGVQTTRFRQKTDALVAKTTFVSQYRRDQQFKAGAEFQWPKLTFGAIGYVAAVTESTSSGPIVVLQRYVSNGATQPDAVTFQPRIGALFAQNEGEWNDLKVRAGLRFEMFQPNALLPSDLHNPANALPPPAPQSVLKPATTKYSLAPRIGVSYPVTTKSALFFAYGHFYQLPALGTVFDNADYNALGFLQAGTANYRLMGNPDIRPERTVQYQFGYKQQVSDAFGVELSTFYKDIRDLLGIELLNTYNDAQYARYTNVDFGSVTGVTVTLNYRSAGALSGTLDYTWQVAQGNSSDPAETANRAAAQEDPRPRQEPFDWDQRHTLNITAMLARPDDYNASAIVRIASGQPYTPSVTTGFNGKLERNSGRKPAAIAVDIRSEKQLKQWGLPATAFLRVFNVFDARYFNGFVFPSTGSPYYANDTREDKSQIADPTRYFAPRKIELGLTLHGGPNQ